MRIKVGIIAFFLFLSIFPLIIFPILAANNSKFLSGATKFYEKRCTKARVVPISFAISCYLFDLAKEQEEKINSINLELEDLNEKVQKLELLLSITPTPVQNEWQFLESLQVQANEPFGASSTSILEAGKEYKIEVVGIWQNYGSYELHDVDAKYISYDSWQTWMDGNPGWPFVNNNLLLETQIDQKFVDWGGYNSDHTYQHFYTGAGSTVNLRVFDGHADEGSINEGWYTDNEGSLTVNIYQK